MDEMKEKLGPEYQLRFVIRTRTVRNGENTTTEEDAWLGIARGPDAKKALMEVENEAQPVCTCCGASNPDIRVI